ncbi:hypothetical protein Lal_00004449 [Lupinus albus]|nr:hypothetical protein Lal_00004449 [Lupinus albus]
MEAAVTATSLIRQIGLQRLCSWLAMGDSGEELNGKLEMWRQTLEAHGFRISQSKIEYMECKFSKRQTNPIVEAKVGDHIIQQVTRSRYLRSIIQDDREIERDENNRMQVGWMRWQSASRVM